MRIGRICPNLDAALFFDPDEIHGAHLVTEKKMPASPPSLNEIVRLIAQVGGILGRKSDEKAGATDYAKSAGKNYATAGATGVLTIISGTTKTDVALQPGADNTLIAKTATPLAAGTRAQANITFADKSTVKADLIAK